MKLDCYVINYLAITYIEVEADKIILSRELNFTKVEKLFIEQRLFDYEIYQNQIILKLKK